MNNIANKIIICKNGEISKKEYKNLVKLKELLAEGTTIRLKAWVYVNEVDVKTLAITNFVSRLGVLVKNKKHLKCDYYEFKVNRKSPIRKLLNSLDLSTHKDACKSLKKIKEEN